MTWQKLILLALSIVRRFVLRRRPPAPAQVAATPPAPDPVGGPVPTVPAALPVVPAEKLPPRRKPMTSVESLIYETASRYNLDPAVALAVARAESCGATCTIEDQNRTSPVGAIGLFQLMPATAADLGVDPYSLEGNIEGGVRYLVQLLNRYGGDLQKALAAYNWGMGNLGNALAQWGADWFYHLPAETRAYIPTVYRYLGEPFSPGGEDLLAGLDNRTLGMIILGLAAVLLLAD